MQQPTNWMDDYHEAPVVTPLCESFPPRFAADEYGGRMTVVPGAAHQIELDVRRALLAEAGVSFDSLVVRRIPFGVCLQGFAEFDDESWDLAEVARTVPGVEEVRNHLVVVERPPRRPR